MTLQKKGCIFLGLAFIFLIEVKAVAEDIVIDNFINHYNPALNLSYLIDHENRLNFDDILNQKYQKEFVDNKMEIPHFGLTEASIWYTFNIQNKSTFDLYMEIDNPALDTVEYYLVDQKGKLVHQFLTGNQVEIKDREIQSGQLLLDLHLTDSSLYTCYLKINSKVSSILTPIRIAPLKTFFETKHTQDIWQGLYFGLILFLFIYNIFLFVSIRDSSYIQFALFIGSIGLLFALFKGFGMQYLWSSYPYFNLLTPVIGSMAGIFIILFSFKFLDVQNNTPIAYKWLMALIGFYFIIILFNIFGAHMLSFKLLEYNSIITIFFLLITALSKWRSGFTPAKYYIIAWSFFVLGMLTYFLREIDLISTNKLTGNILQIGSTATILFMSFALSKKINIYINTKNEAQELAINAAVETEKLISNQNLLLEAKVYQRTVDLEESITTLSKQSKDLHEANNFKDKVFSIISHDLKSPIATLAGMLKVMKLKSLSEVERTNVVDKLEIALKNTKILLDNILAWANRDEQKSLDCSEVALYDCVDEIIKLFQFQAQDKQIELINNIEERTQIYANKNMLQLVLRNLISNALKFTPKNGQISIDMKEELQHILLIVKDSGIGMNEETMTNLFKANKHTSTRGTENEKGTGLGLKLCKEFVDKYNGELFVSSKVGKGTTFTLKLKDAIPILKNVMW